MTAIVATATATATASRALAAEPSRTRLTESAAVASALRNPALADLRAGWTGEATAEGLERTTWSDPSFSYTREQLLGTEPIGEDYASISQTFDVSGRKRLARRASQHRQDAAGHRADAAAADIAAEVRRRFYRLLAAQERMRALEAWHGQVDARLADVAKRERAGDAAAYDRLRLERELSGIEASLRRERAAATGAWTLLSALVAGQTEPSDPSAGVPTLDGQILPGAAPEPSAAAKATRAAPEARAREAEASALTFDRRASSRWWIPSPNLGAGYKGVELPGGGRAHGFVVTLGIPLPLFDRQRAERTRVEARARALRAETSLRTLDSRARATALAQEVADLTLAARTLARTGTEQGAALVRAAESGYRGGEVGVLEVVDAYRSAVEAELTVIDLAMQARMAQIDLRRLTETPS